MAFSKVYTSHYGILHDECFLIINLRSSVKVGGFQYLLKFSLISPHGCSLKEAWRHRLQQISVCD